MKGKTEKETFTEVKKSQTDELFTIVKHDKETQICVGNVVISAKKFKSIVEAEKYIASKPYELIINTACYCMQENLKQQTNENK